jgi:hypothetical protein
MNTTAHITFTGGGLVLPARDPYERDLLAEHVVERARRNRRVQVIVHGRAWNVRPAANDFRGTCTRCGRVLQATWYAAATGGSPYCIRCACGDSGIEDRPGSYPCGPPPVPDRAAPPDAPTRSCEADA